MAIIQVQVGMNNDYATSSTKLNDYAAFIIVREADFKFVDGALTVINGPVIAALKTDGMNRADFFAKFKQLAATYKMTGKPLDAYNKAKAEVLARIAEGV